jgi:hypothetical protein
VILQTNAGADSNFEMLLSDMAPGSYLFSLYAQDAAGRRSNQLVFPVSITKNVVTEVGGIFLAPTIDVDKSEVKKGDTIAIFGQTAHVSEVLIQVNSAEPYFAKTNADANGVYLYNFDTSPLEYGDHSTKTKSAKDAAISPYSASVGFIVGTKNVLMKPVAPTCKRADFNCDGKVNLVDFSILLFWYKRPNPIEKVDLNNDKQINLVDFSILAFHWTG